MSVDDRQFIFYGKHGCVWSDTEYGIGVQGAGHQLCAEMAGEILKLRAEPKYIRRDIAASLAADDPDTITTNELIALANHRTRQFAKMALACKDMEQEITRLREQLAAVTLASGNEGR